MTNNTHDTIFIACDTSPTGGEGRLACLLIDGLTKKHHLEPQVTSVRRAVPGQLVAPSIDIKSGLVRWMATYWWLLLQLVWLRVRPQQNVMVLNYIPLWNVLFFVLVPKTVAIGPVTGGGHVNLRHLHMSGGQRMIVMYTRNVLIPFLYWLSVRLIRLRRLIVKPATAGVAIALGEPPTLPRIVEADHVPFLVKTAAPEMLSIETDIIVYVGAHLMKNRDLSVEVVNQLAEKGKMVTLVGTLGNGQALHENVTHFERMGRYEVLTAMRRSKVALSLSLEQGGFFTYEAAVLGAQIYCLPDSGGARLPGAVLLASADEILSVELMVERCLVALETTDQMTESERASHANAMRKVHEDAKTYFFAG